MWPLFVSWHRCHMWVECVVGSFPCSERFFSGHSSFPLSLKPILPNSISIWNAQTHFNEFSRTPKRSIGKQITITFFFYDLLSPSWCNLIQMLRVQSEVKNKFFDYSLFHFPFSNLQVRRICTYSLSFLP